MLVAGGRNDGESEVAGELDCGSGMKRLVRKAERQNCELGMTMRSFAVLLPSL